VHPWLEQHCSLVQLTQAFQAGSETSLLFGTIRLCPRAGVLSALDCNESEKGGKKEQLQLLSAKSSFRPYVQSPLNTHGDFQGSFSGYLISF